MVVCKKTREYEMAEPKKIYPKKKNPHTKWCMAKKL